MVYRASPSYRYQKAWYVIAFLLVALVVAGSVWQRPPQVLFTFTFADKLMHFTAYFSLMFWYLQLTYSVKFRLFYALVFIGLGVAMEFLQAAGGVRMFDWYDALANTVGVLIAFSLGYTKAEGLLALFETRYLVRSA